jgi:cell wall-associated NlpC family hydrolase
VLRRILNFIVPVVAATTLSAAVVSLTPGSPASADASIPASFWLANANGGVWAFGAAGKYGSAGALSLASPIVSITSTPDTAGYWLAAADGGVFSFGDAVFYGSTGAERLVRPIVGMAATPDGSGYWLVASDGGVFSFGHAGFFGSAGAKHLAQPIVSLVPTLDGGGYWLLARDGGVFSFGDAGFFGSAGGSVLASPMLSLAPTPDGKGYWLMAADGGIFAYGDAGFYGSMGASPSQEPAEKVVSSTDGLGYWIVDQNGTSYGYGDAVGSPPTQALMFSGVTKGDKAVLFAFAQLGKPYIWGGNGPVGYDCSGLALASWVRASGISFARVANDQYHTAGSAIPMGNLVAGDLVFWGDGVASDWTTVYHTAMYVGGDRIVEATGDHVQLNTLGQWGERDVMPHGIRP